MVVKAVAPSGPPEFRPSLRARWARRFESDTMRPSTIDLDGLTLVVGYAGQGKSEWLHAVKHARPQARLYGQNECPPDLDSDGLLLSWTISPKQLWLCDDPTHYFIDQESQFHAQPILSLTRFRKLRDLGHGLVVARQTLGRVGLRPGFLGLGESVSFEEAADRYILFRSDRQDQPPPLVRDFPAAADWISQLSVGEWALWEPGTPPSFHRWPMTRTSQ